MKKAALLLAAMLLFALAVPAMAQRMFEDVPTDHWAYQAVSSLQERGVVIGYPDGTFSGKRAMTRYEFAVATARLLDWVNSQLDSRIQEAVSRVTPGIDEGRAREIAREVAREEAGKVRDAAVSAARDAAQEAVGSALANVPTKEDLERVRRLAEEFRDELATLGADVQRIQDDLRNLKNRVSAIEEKFEKVKVSGEGTAIWRGAHARKVAGVRKPISDLDSRTDLTRGRDPSNILDSSQVLYQLAVGVDAKIAENITGGAVLVSGNYLPWASSNRQDLAVRGNFGSDARNLASSELTPWKLYVQGTVGDWWFLKDLEVTIGKFGMQLGPYTLKQVDPDSYTTTMVTDSGDVIMSGIAAKASLGRIELMAYAATHDRGLNNKGYPIIQQGFPIDQSAAIRGKVNLGKAALGVTYMEGGVSAPSVSAKAALGKTYMEGGVSAPSVANGRRDVGRREVQRTQVISADLNVPITENLSLAAYFSRSDLLQSEEPGKTATIGNRETAFPPGTDKNAWDARLNLGLGRLSLAASYKRIDPFFGAPGYWGAIGRWKNPTNIDGWNGEVAWAFSEKVNLTGAVGVYDGAVESAGFDWLVQHYRAGLRFDLSEANRIDLGWEDARVRAGSPAKTKETYYTIGFTRNMSENASWKVAYQIVDYKDHGVGWWGSDYRGGIGVTQVSVRF
ncbi:MAG: S-layer homology domain-containing protein [Armatimonadota bacterium]